MNDFTYDRSDFLEGAAAEYFIDIMQDTDYDSLCNLYGKGYEDSLKTIIDLLTNEFEDEEFNKEKVFQFLNTLK